MAVFSSSVLANLKATAQVKVSVYGSYIVEHIAEQVRDGKSQGNGHWDGVNFKWRVSDVESAPLQLRNNDSGVAPSKTINLNNVTVTFETNTVQQVKEISVVSWGMQ